MSPTVTDHTTLSTPLMDRGALVTAAISQATRALDTTNDDDELSAERPKYLKLVLCCNRLLTHKRWMMPQHLCLCL